MGGVCGQMIAGKQKCASTAVENNRIIENLWALRILRGKRSADKGPRFPILFCSSQLEFPAEDFLEPLPQPSCCRRQIARRRVDEDFGLRRSGYGVFLSAQNRQRPERRPRGHLYADSSGKVAGSRAAPTSVSFKVAALGKSQQSFGNSLSPPGTLRTSRGRAAKSHRCRAGSARASP